MAEADHPGAAAGSATPSPPVQLSNVPIRTAMELMRHKEFRLTLKIYIDAGQLDLDEAVSRLPDLSSSLNDGPHSDSAEG